MARRRSSGGDAGVPPVNPSAPESYADEAGMLTAYLNELQTLLDDALERRPHVFDHRVSQLRLAWPDVKTKFDIAREGLARPETANGRVYFEQRGLTGPELDLKLDLFRSARDDYERRAQEEDQVERLWTRAVAFSRGLGASRLIRGARDRVMAGARWATRGAFGVALRVADIPLGSLGKALDAVFQNVTGVGMIYGAAVEGIKEFKESAEEVAGLSQQADE
jgi:hypothetical protein